MKERDRNSAAQVAVGKKAAALKSKPAVSPDVAAANQASIIESGFEADIARARHDRHRVHGARALPVRLLDKADVCAIANVTFPTIWAWMRAGKFPRGRVVGGKTMWVSSEIDAWMTALPPRLLKGDAPGGVSKLTDRQTNNERCP